ncbi:hypothetical protein D3C75_585430 [compost metagenome]
MLCPSPFHLPLISAQISLPHSRIQAVPGDECPMITALGNFSVLQHKNLPGITDGRQPVRNNQHGFAAHQLTQGKLHLMLVLRIGKSSRLIKHEHRRIPQNRPGYGNPLLFAAGQINAALADQRLVALRQPADKIIALGCTRCGFNLRLGSSGAAYRNIFIQRIVEKKRFLEYKSHGIHQLMDCHIADIHPSDENGPRTRVPETRHQTGDSRLA